MTAREIFLAHFQKDDMARSLLEACIAEERAECVRQILDPCYTDPGNPRADPVKLVKAITQRAL